MDSGVSLYFRMVLAAFHVDSGHGAGGTIIFTSATAETTVLVDGGHAVDHQDGSGGAMAGAGTATDTIVRQHHRTAHADGSLLFFVDGTDGIRGADLATTRAGQTTVALVESHIGLHKRSQVCGGAQHLFGALAHTKLTSGAMRLEMLQANSTRRFQRHISLGHLLVLNDGESAVKLLFLSLKHSDGPNSGCSGQKSAARGVDRVGRVDRTRRFRGSR